MIKQAIRALTIGESTISSIVSDRLYLDSLPQDPVLPCLTYSRVTSAVQDYAHNGSTIREGIFQINCWARKGKDCDDLATAIENFWHLKRYTYEDPTTHVKATILRAFVSNLIDLGRDPDLDFYQIAVELTLQYQ